jgi:hypothetical protein
MTSPIVSSTLYAHLPDSILNQGNAVKRMMPSSTLDLDQNFKECPAVIRYQIQEFDSGQQNLAKKERKYG